METKDSVYKALARAKKTFKPLKQSGKAQFGKFHTLKDIMDAVGKSLEDNDLLLYFTLKHITENVAIPVDTLYCIIAHPSSNTKLISEVKLDSNNKGPQGTGGAITYMRRYTLQALLNLMPDDATEDDGDFVSTGKKPKKPF
tara:strand:+ start:1897 stop:2322 length:426 start_codon:yes stop_codon:yes gene_type:complete